MFCLISSFHSSSSGLLFLKNLFISKLIVKDGSLRSRHVGRADTRSTPPSPALICTGNKKQLLDVTQDPLGSHNSLTPDSFFVFLFSSSAAATVPRLSVRTKSPGRLTERPTGTAVRGLQVPLWPPSSPNRSRRAAAAAGQPLPAPQRGEEEDGQVRVRKMVARPPAFCQCWTADWPLFSVVQSSVSHLPVADKKKC